jgi:hypothetical protein
VRDAEIVLSRAALVLILAGGACKSEEPVTDPASKRGAAPGPETKPAAVAADEIEAEGAKASEASEPPRPSGDRDPERADKLADLDDLCRALDRDYVDGTLSDYYRGLELRTEWGAAQRKAGDESIQPGRLLEQAVAELSPGAKDPALGHCRKLLDYLDDVE